MDEISKAPEPTNQVIVEAGANYPTREVTAVVRFIASSEVRMSVPQDLSGQSLMEHVRNQVVGKLPELKANAGFEFPVEITVEGQTAEFE